MANDEYREPQQADRDAGLRARHETRLRRAIRREVAEEIATAIEALRDRRGGVSASESAELAREIGSKGGSDD